MYKLYYSPGACSMAVHVLLNEVGAHYELVRTAISEGQTRTPEFLKINPRGQIPVLEIGGSIMREGGAMMLHIAENHKSPLLPVSGEARREAIEWLSFCNATLHPAYSRAFFLMRNVQNPGEKETLGATAAAMINKLWDEVEQRLQTRDYLCGPSPTLADILMTVIANWSDHVGQPVNIGPRTRALFARMIARPAYQKALQAEQVQYKMAS